MEVVRKYFIPSTPVSSIIEASWLRVKAKFVGAPTENDQQGCQHSRSRTSRLLGPLLFILLTGLFWGLLLLIGAFYAASRAIEYFRRSRAAGIEEKDSIEDLVTEEELQLCIPEKIFELEELEELCSALSSPTSTFDEEHSDSHSDSETLAPLEDQDPFYSSSENDEEATFYHINPFPLVYFLHRKLEGLPYRPDAEHPHHIRRLAFLDLDEAKKGDPQYLIHGHSPLSQCHSPASANTVEDPETPTDEVDLFFAEVEESDEEDVFVLKRSRRTRIPRVRKFSSLPSIDTAVFTNQYVTAYDCYDEAWQKKRNHLRREQRQAMADFLSE